MDKRYEGMVRYSKENNEITKKALKETLIKLLRTQEFDSITVSKLCRVAGVSRMSFYRNYSIVHDIFKDLAVDFNVEIIKAVGSPFRNGTDINWYKKTFSIILERKEDYLLLSQKHFQEEWLKVVNQLANHDESFLKEKHYQRLMWVGGFENVASEWISGGYKESADEISLYCAKYLPNLLKEGM